LTVSDIIDVHLSVTQVSGSNKVLTVTNGLLARVQTDSQLAYMVAYELARYMADHEGEAHATTCMIRWVRWSVTYSVPFVVAMTAQTSFPQYLWCATLIPMLNWLAAPLVAHWEAQRLFAEAEYIGLGLTISAGFNLYQAVDVVPALLSDEHETNVPQDDRRDNGPKRPRRHPWLSRNGYLDCSRSRLQEV